MYRLSKLSTARPLGELSRAAVGTPPSPLKPAVPVPATVVIVPSASTLRTRWLLASAMYRLPLLSNTMSWGLSICAIVAGPPSPLKPALPGVPATVVITPAVSILRMAVFHESAMYRLPEASSAKPWGALIWAMAAGPPSPLWPPVPVPATVVITPAVSTLRMRWLLVSAMYMLPDASATASPGPVEQSCRGLAAVAAVAVLDPSAARHFGAGARGQVPLYDLAAAPIGEIQDVGTVHGHSACGVRSPRERRRPGKLGDVAGESPRGAVHLAEVGRPGDIQVVRSIYRHAPRESNPSRRGRAAIPQVAVGPASRERLDG